MMNKKVPVIIIGGLVVILLVVFVLFKNNESNSNNPNDSKEYSYMIINNESIWEYNGSWIKSNNSLIDNTNLETYINNVYSGFYTYKLGNVWNLFDGNNLITYDGLLIGFSKNLGRVININKVDIDSNDLNVINGILNKSIGIDDINKYEKVNIDLDNNGIMDSIIYVTNIMDEELNSYFSLLYVVFNGSVYVLKNDDVTNDNFYEEPLYSIKAVVDINGKSVNNIIIEKGYFSNVNKTGNIMYQYNKDSKKYEIVIQD